MQKISNQNGVTNRGNLKTYILSLQSQKEPPVSEIEKVNFQIL